MTLDMFLTHVPLGLLFIGHYLSQWKVTIKNRAELAGTGNLHSVDYTIPGWSKTNSARAASCSVLLESKMNT